MVGVRAEGGVWIKRNLAKHLGEMAPWLGGVGECIDVRSGVDLPGEADSCAVERREGKSEGLSGAVGGGIRVFTARDGVAMGVVP